MGCHARLTINPTIPTFKSHPTILANIIHTCHVGFHVDFPYTKNVMGYGSKPFLCKLKAGACDTLN